jgi:hypothetical protein
VRAVCSRKTNSDDDDDVDRHLVRHSQGLRSLVGHMHTVTYIVSTIKATCQTLHSSRLLEVWALCAACKLHPPNLKIT